MFENEPWLSVGDNGGSFGITRTLVKFPDLADEVPSDAEVYNADLKLWKPMTFGAGERHDIHALTREFDETTATWNEAADGVPWDTPGGDFDPQVVDYVPTVGQAPKFHVWWIDDLVAQWVSDPSSNHGALIKTENESAGQLTVFDSAELASESLLRPQLHVTYEATEPPPNEPPVAPSDLHTTSPATECVTGQDRPLIREATPVLRATLTDPDGDDLQAGFSVVEVASGTEVWSPPLTDPAPSGSEHTVTVPDGTLADGATYQWRVNGIDEHGTAGPHADCEFTTDLTAPDTPPGVAPVPGESAQYHEGETAGGIGVAGAFEFTNAGVPDVVSFDYSFDSETLDENVTVADGATVSFTPATAGEHTLRVRSVDEAGWTGPVRTYVFTVADTPDPDDHTWTYSHNADGQRTTVTDPLGNETTGSYDTAGRLTGETDANGHTTGYTYDTLDRLTEVTGPDGATTTYGYDTAGDLVSRTDPNEHVTTYAYNQNHQLTEITDPLDRVTGYSYDPDGNLTQTTTARGITIDNTYDARGLLLDVDTGDPASSTSYIYDAAGRRTSATTASGTMATTYDDAGRLVEVSDGTDTYTYTHNSRGLVTSRTYPDGRTITTTYNPDGQQSQQTVDGGATAQFDYNPNGNLATVDYPGGAMSQQIDYDPTGRVTSMAATTTAGASTSIDYTYDPVGNPTQTTTTRDGTVETESYFYDEAKRLTRACYHDQTDPPACSSSAASTIGYSYDPVGNRLTESRVGVDNPGNITYTYDAADQLLSRGTISYGYDPDGNQSTAGDTTRDYDALNRLVAVDTGTQQATIAYDALSNRDSVTTAGSTTSFDWDINMSLPTLVGVDHDGATTGYRYDPAGRPLSTDIDGSQYLLTTDALSSVTDMTDTGTGEPAWHTGYEPFGTPRDTVETEPGTPAAGLGYTGAYTDPTTDLVHLRARDYNPTTGRFTTVDPVTPQLDDPYVATYVYVSNQPTVLTDPSGACFECIIDPIGTAKRVRDAATSLISTVEEEGLPSKQELATGAATGSLRAGEDTALWLSGFDNPQLQEAMGWDGRTLTDRLEQALIDAGMNPTWLCGSALVGEYGTYIGTAFTGTGTARSTSGVANRLLRNNADDTAQAASTASRFGELAHASAGIAPYSTQRALTVGQRGETQAHHLIERRFADVIGGNTNDWASIVVTRSEHQVFTNAWRQAIPYGAGTRNATRADVQNAAQQIYADFPEILRALGLG